MNHTLKFSVLGALVLFKKRQQVNTEHFQLLRTKKAKQVFSFSRWVHIYFSCALFSLLLFFCLTGITLNHADWASTKPEEIHTLVLPESFSVLDLEGGEYPLKRLQTYIESATGLVNPRSVDVLFEDKEITYDFPLPSGYAFVSVYFSDSIIEIEYVSGDFLSLLNDLHKGRHSGIFWSWLIDISAALMVLFSLTGLIILFQNAKHRKQATYTLLLGIFTPIIIYLILVPRFTL